MIKKITYIILSMFMSLVVGGCDGKEVESVITHKNIIIKKDNKQDINNKLIEKQKEALKRIKK